MARTAIMDMVYTRIPRPMNRQFKKLAKQSGLSHAAQHRRAIEEYLERHQAS